VKVGIVSLADGFHCGPRERSAYIAQSAAQTYSQNGTT
jgi:hypothetical protein